MENSSIQPHDVLTDYASVKEQVQGLSDAEFDVLCDGVAEHIFTSRPPASTLAPHFAALLRHAAERNPALAKALVATKMAAYTSQQGPHYSEENEEYLIDLSKQLHKIEDYRKAFTLIGEAIRSGQLPSSTVPEVKAPEPTPES
jgi:hypothetical protein